jgi:mycothiol synthase
VTAQRIVAEAIRDLPAGLVAAPARPADAEAITALYRADDLAFCGHTTSNLDEVVDELGGPHCGWEHGAACVWRGEDLVGLLTCYDGLAVGRGWGMDALVLPGLEQADALAAALVDAGLREGAHRSTDLERPAQGGAPMARSYCYAADVGLRRILEDHGFVEVRRFWRMGVRHEPGATIPAADPAGYRLLPCTDDEVQWRALHAAQMAAFLDHFDFVPIGYEDWRALMHGATEDPTQWILAEPVDAPGTVAGWVRGSNRYATEGAGYVASIGVLREHRGRGLARALLRARLADDAARGFERTLLHVDSESPTGATRLYEGVGMRVDTESVTFQRPLAGS